MKPYDPIIPLIKYGEFHSSNIDTISVQDHLNGYRLCVIIIDIAGKYLREKLVEKIESKYGDQLDLYYKQIELKLKGKNADHFKTILNQMKQKPNKQTLLYYHEKSIESYDLCLCIVVFEFIFGFSNKNERINFYRLRDLRNQLYGHIVHFGRPKDFDSLDNAVFNQQVDQLRNILSNLVPNKKQIIFAEIEEVCKRVIVDKDKLDNYVVAIRNKYIRDANDSLNEYVKQTKINFVDEAYKNLQSCSNPEVHTLLKKYSSRNERNLHQVCRIIAEDYGKERIEYRTSYLPRSINYNADVENQIHRTKASNHKRSLLYRAFIIFLIVVILALIILIVLVKFQKI